MKNQQIPTSPIYTSFDKDTDEGTDEEDESDYTQDDEDDEAPINA